MKRYEVHVLWNNGSVSVFYHDTLEEAEYSKKEKEICEGHLIRKIWIEKLL